MPVQAAIFRPYQRLVLLTTWWAIVLLSVTPVFGQTSSLKHQAAYEQLQQTTTYGRDAKAGEYYSIRGFQMYCAVGLGKPVE